MNFKDAVTFMMKTPIIDLINKFHSEGDLYLIGSRPWGGDERGSDWDFIAMPAAYETIKNWLTTEEKYFFENVNYKSFTVTDEANREVNIIRVPSKEYDSWVQSAKICEFMSRDDFMKEFFNDRNNRINIFESLRTMINMITRRERERS